MYTVLRIDKRTFDFAAIGFFAEKAEAENAMQKDIRAVLGERSEAFDASGCDCISYTDGLHDFAWRFKEIDLKVQTGGSCLQVSASQGRVSVSSQCDAGVLYADIETPECTGDYTAAYTGITQEDGEPIDITRVRNMSGTSDASVDVFGRDSYTSVFDAEF